MAADLVARLRKLDSCAVSDALDRCGYTGVALGLRPLAVPARIAGRVVTVRLKPKGQEESSRHLGTAAIGAAQAGDVIVVDHQGRDDAAGWGGILSRAAQIKGIAGVVVDGACRDIDESREIGFPVFGVAAVPLTARGRAVEESFNEPISIRGIPVRPDDLVLADGSGVVFVQAAYAEEVITVAEQIAAREAAMTQAVLAGEPVSDVMGRDYEIMLRT
jgi:regulator of RNase E activity RraA